MTDQSVQKKSKEYVRPMPAMWWLGKKAYFLFMVRELTCLFVGGYALFLLVLIAQNQPTFKAVLTHPLSMVLHLLALPMVLYHSFTWFNLTPQAMVVWRGEERVSPLLIAGSNYVMWLIVSALVAWVAYLYR